MKDIGNEDEVAMKEKGTTATAPNQKVQAQHFQ